LVTIGVIIRILGLLPLPTVDGLRLSGAVLELLGICTVAKGVIDKSKQFGTPGVRGRIREWLRRCPIRKRDQILRGVGMAGESEAAGHLTVRMTPRQDATLEQRVKALEENFRQLDGDLNTIRQNHRKDIDTIRRRFDEERQSRQQQETALKSELTRLGVGNLYWEGLGTMWLILGVPLTSISAQITHLLRILAGI